MRCARRKSTWQTRVTGKGHEGKACPERVEAGHVRIVFEGVEQQGGGSLDAQVLFQGKLIC